MFFTKQEWLQNTEEKKITGVLLWDLTAAFDTLDCEILCNKLMDSNSKEFARTLPI